MGIILLYNVTHLDSFRLYDIAHPVDHPMRTTNSSTFQQ